MIPIDPPRRPKPGERWGSRTDTCCKELDFPEIHQKPKTKGKQLEQARAYLTFAPWTIGRPEQAGDLTTRPAFSFATCFCTAVSHAQLAKDPVMLRQLLATTVEIVLSWPRMQKKT